jgi:hypothetical protein
VSIPVPSEAALLKACLRYLALRGVFCWRASNHAVRRRKGGREFWAFHGLAGVSDVLGVLPRLDDGRTGVLLAVEVKAPGGRVSPAQQAFLDRVNGAGGVAVVADSLASLGAKLRERGF